MDGVFIPFLSTIAWFVASAFFLLLLLVIFGYYVYQRSRMRALIGDSGNMATLIARKEQLQADVIAMRDWMLRQKRDVSLLEGERHQQELVRAELSRLEKDLIAKQREHQDMASKMADFDYQLDLKRQLREKLEKEISSMEGKQVEAAALDRQLEDLRREVEKLKPQAVQVAELEAKHMAFSAQAHLLEQDIATHQQTLRPLRDEKLKLQEEINDLAARQAALTLEVEKLKREAGEASPGNDQEKKQRKKK
ncbi:hypothetical protein LJC71_03640 [Desulfosarcina sp. OttesenSCG-928-A07]|nr:hypothetical protein [Desulfosarcina sp. OttesenSCG-928-A07]